MFRAACPNRVRSVIGAKLTLPPILPEMPLYTAAAYLPGFPSPSVLYKLYRSGVLQGSVKSGRVVVTPAAIKDAASKLLPAGLWFGVSNLRLYCDDPRLILSLLPKDAYAPYPDPGSIPCCRRILYADAIAVTQAISMSGDCLRVPAAAVSRSMSSMQLTGIGTL